MVLLASSLSSHLLSGQIQMVKHSETSQLPLLWSILLQMLAGSFYGAWPNRSPLTEPRMLTGR
jgi:hypothetical protein